MILRLCRASAEPLILRSCRVASVMPPIHRGVRVEPPGCLKLPPPGTVGQNVDPDVHRKRIASTSRVATGFSAQHLVVIFPLWNGAMSALLEQVVRLGVALRDDA